MFVLLRDIIGNKTQNRPNGRFFLFKLLVCTILGDKSTAEPGWLKYGGKINTSLFSVYPESERAGYELFGLVVQLLIEFVTVIGLIAQRWT